MWVTLVVTLCFTKFAHAQGTSEFGYHGEVRDNGQLPTGLYDFKFSLYDAASSGNLIGSIRTNTATPVTQGLFDVTLDFGGTAFGGAARWLEIGIRSNITTDFIPLLPRQVVTPIPYALTASNLSGVLPAAQIRGTLPPSTLPSMVVTNNASGVILHGTFNGNATGLTNFAAQSIALTNLTFDNSLRIASANIDAYGVHRFGWPKTLAKLSTNGLLFLSIVGNGWVEDSEFGGFVTNLLAYKPLAGYASDVLYYLPALIGYGPYSGNDTALFVNGDDTNWHGFYFVLTNTGNISAPSQTLVSDICSIHYLANPNGGDFAFEIRTNGAWPYDFTNLDSTWTTVANANALSTGWEGRTLWWTNSMPVQTQIRVRATTPGWTPIVGHAQWNSTITNGVVLSQYSHQSSGNWWTYTVTNKVFPIWQTWTPDLVIWTGGFDNQRSADLIGTMALLRKGFSKSDIVDVGAHLVFAYYNYSFERQYCFANGIPFFDGQAASTAAWGSYNNGVALGLYQDTAHFTAKGYAAFGELLWTWMGLTSIAPEYGLALRSQGVTTNISVLTALPNEFFTLCFTNGVLMNVK
jgi:hypothetical protein